MQNDADVLLLIKLFGTKMRYFEGLPVTDPMDFFTWIDDVLGNETPSNMPNKTWKQLINDNWSKKSQGIKARL